MVDAGPKVVSLRGGEIRLPGAPRPSVIDALEQALEMARNGEIVGVVAVFNHADEAISSIQHGFADDATVGRLEITKADLLDRLRAL